MSSFSGGGKIQMERVYQILDQLKRGGYPNCSTLAKKLEYSAKTIQRDLNFMQDRLGIPVSYDASHHGYELTRSVDEFPVFDIQVEDLAALFLARQALATVQGTQLAESLTPAFERITNQLRGKVSLQWRDLNEVFSVKEGGVVDADLTLFGQLAEAVIKQRCVHFFYKKLDSNTAECRHLHPYHVGEISGGWYVIGRDEDRDGLRTFALQRISSLEVMDTTFERPADFKIGEHLGGSIGVWDKKSEKCYEIIIEAHSWVARLVQERIWHASQRITELDDTGNRVELRMQLENLEEIKQLVMSWGACAKVICPQELADMIKAEAKAIAKLY